MKKLYPCFTIDSFKNQLIVMLKKKRSWLNVSLRNDLQQHHSMARGVVVSTTTTKLCPYMQALQP